MAMNGGTSVSQSPVVLALPLKEPLIQMLRAAWSLHDYITAAKHFRCIWDNTEEHTQTHQVWPPRPCVFNHEVGINIIEVLDAARKRFSVLNAVCMGTTYDQSVTITRWRYPLGRLVELVRCDQGTRIRGALGLISPRWVWRSDVLVWKRHQSTNWRTFSTKEGLGASHSSSGVMVWQCQSSFCPRSSGQVSTRWTSTSTSSLLFICSWIALRVAVAPAFGSLDASVLSAVEVRVSSGPLTSRPDESWHAVGGKSRTCACPQCRSGSASPGLLWQLLLRHRKGHTHSVTALLGTHTHHKHARGTCGARRAHSIPTMTQTGVPRATDESLDEDERDVTTTNLPNTLRRVARNDGKCRRMKELRAHHHLRLENSRLTKQQILSFDR